jgi:hypothetical protein
VLRSSGDRPLDRRSGSFMTTSFLKTEIEPAPETSCRPISNIPQTVNSGRHSIMNRMFSVSFPFVLQFSQ